MPWPVRALPFAVIAALLTGCAPSVPAVQHLPVRLRAADRVSPAPIPPAPTAELAYVTRFWERRNAAVYGDLGGTDCMNLTSQALHARGWAETADWHGSAGDWSPAWVSSTAFERWLAAHPSWATATDSADGIAVGDVAQFDWDDSGDRDHTAVVSRILRRDDRVDEVDVAEHSPSDLERPVAQLLAQHGPAARVHYWHLRR